MGEVHFKHSGPVSVPLYGASLPDDLKKIEEELAKRAGDNSAKESFVRYVKDFIAAHHIKNSADLKRALPELLNPAGAADIYSKCLGLMESDLFDLCSAIDPKVSAAAIPQISDSDMSNAVFYWIGENAKESPFDPSDNPFAPPDAPKGSNCSAMSFNIRDSRARDGRHCWNNRKDHIEEQIRKTHPSFLGLQEVSTKEQQKWVQMICKELGYVEVHFDGASDDVMLVDPSKFALATNPDGSPMTYKVDRNAGEHILCAKFIDKATGKEVVFMTTHISPNVLSPDEISRVHDGLKKMREFFGENTPEIMVGDFSGDPSARDDLKQAFGVGSDFTDTNIHHKGTRHGGHDWDDDDNNPHVDDTELVFGIKCEQFDVEQYAYDKYWNPERRKYDDDYSSDHWAIVAYYTI